jgi:hypothetical protein
MLRLSTLFLKNVLSITLIFTVSQQVSAQIVINEFMASNDSWEIPGEDPSATFPDWIEIYNPGNTPIDMGGWYASDDLIDLMQWQLPTDKPELTTVPAHGYLLLLCDGLDNSDGALHTNFKLGGSGEDIVISQDGFTANDGGSYCDTGCDYPNPGTDNSSGRSADGANDWDVFIFGSNSEPTPGAANDGIALIHLAINEFMALNDFSFPGPQGDFPDWIEIYNAGSEDVMLGGYYLADNLTDPSAMYQIPDTYPDSVTVPAGGYILFYANKGQASSVLNLNFKLSGGGEQVGLWDPDQIILDSLTYGSQTADISYGRFPDGSNLWMSFTFPTPGESNAVSSGPLIIEVIREPQFPEFTDEVIITAQVTSGFLGLSVSLKYNTGSGYIDVEMLDDGLSGDGEAGDDVFGGTIPAMEKGSNVNWYIVASDDAPSTTFFPAEGAANPLTYTVTDWTPVAIYDMPFEEPSGLAYNPQTSTLFTNNDGSVSNIYEISTTAELLNTIVTNGTDYEGIAFSINYDTIFVVEEINWKVVMLDLSGNWLGEFEVDHDPNQVSGLEGITIDPETGHVFVLAEKNDPQLIELTVEGVELFRTTLNFSTDVSGICFHPVWNNLFIVSDEGFSLNEVTKSGVFLRSWYIPLDQAEGVTFGETENTIYMVADRGNKLYNFDFNFDPYQPSTALVINEFMASNDSWEIPGEEPSAPFPDWIEIYNTSDTPIDMGGWYATDDIADSIKWQLPTDKPELTTIPVNGHLLLLCDGLDNSIGALHTNFKLSGGGEAVGIWQEGTGFTEKFTYCDTGCDLPNPGTDNSSGRDGDGDDSWIVYQMNSAFEPTPGTANGIFVSVISYSNVDFTPLSVYPNPTTGSEVNFNKIVNIQVYNLAGQRLFADNNVSRLDVSRFDSGLYLIKTNEGELVKLIIK